MSRIYNIRPAKISTIASPIIEQRGRHVAWAISKCVDCHGEDLGGSIYSEGQALGRFTAANLTSGRGGIAAKYEDADWVNAIRHGIHPDGRPLIFMPAHEFYLLTDRDLGALIVYLKELKPVNRVLPPTRAGVLARYYYLTGRLNLIPAEGINHSGPRLEATPRGITRAYGKYLIDVGGCRECHGADLSGQPVPFAPSGTAPSADLTRGGDLDHWTEEDFFEALRFGREPDGGNLESFMPWKYTALLSDDELRAMWVYLQTL